MTKDNIVIDAKYFEKDGVKYYVDGKNVVLDYSTKEKEIAIWLVNNFGGKLYMIPRINNPEGIKTPDYIWNDEKWDLKVISGNGKNTLWHSLEHCKEQANNFIIDISNLNFQNIYKQLHLILNNNHSRWINNIILIKNNKLLYKRSDPTA